MKNFRQRFARFMLRNRNKGIPNLMLYICIGTAIVTVIGMINGGQNLYLWLRFDTAAILQGQVWRLFSWLLTERLGGGLVSLLFIYFFYRLGNAVELSIGSLKFNLFYLTGVLVMDIFFLVFQPVDGIIIGNIIITPAYLLHMSMALSFATMYPDSKFILFFILPIKAWIIALVDLLLIGICVFNLCYPVFYFPLCLFPVVGLLNYFLFFGAEMGNLIPLTWRVKLQRRRTQKAKSQASAPKAVQFRKVNTKPDYNHRCEVCGRTDVTNPELEFRYCSRCSGYHCYCQDHISDHTHIE